jgi:hypothetical protein
VTNSGFVYRFLDNHDPDGDSNATSITVSNPEGNTRSDRGLSTGGGDDFFPPPIFSSAEFTCLAMRWKVHHRARLWPYSIRASR